MLYWWWPGYTGPGSAAGDGRPLPPWAGYIERTLVQKSFAWATAGLMTRAGQARRGPLRAGRAAAALAASACTARRRLQAI